MRSRHGLAVGAVVLLVAATACDADEDRERAEKSASISAASRSSVLRSVASAAAPPSFAEPPLPTTPVRVTAGQTLPSARLRIGQRAVVPLRNYRPNPTGPARIENGVVGIVPGRIRSIPGTRLKGNFDKGSRLNLRSVRVYYARVVLTNIGGTALTPGKPRLSLDSSKPDDPRRYEILTGGSVPGCPEQPVPPGFTTGRTSWQTCVFAVSRPERPLDIVSYEAAPYGSEQQPQLNPKLNRYYERGAITWR